MFYSHGEEVHWSLCACKVVHKGCANTIPLNTNPRLARRYVTRSGAVERTTAAGSEGECHELAINGEWVSGVEAEEGAAGGGWRGRRRDRGFVAIREGPARVFNGQETQVDL